MIKDIIYPAIFAMHPDEDCYSIIFPDIPGAVTQGEGDAVLEWWQEGEVFCDEKCLLEYAGATPVILGY